MKIVIPLVIMALLFLASFLIENQAVKRLSVEVMDKDVSLRILKDRVPDLMTELGTCEATIENQTFERIDTVNEARDKLYECQGQLTRKAINMYQMSQQIIGLSNDLNQCKSSLWRSL